MNQSVNPLISVKALILNTHIENNATSCSGMCGSGSALIQ